VRRGHSNVELIEVFATDDVAAWSDVPQEHPRPTPPQPTERNSRRGVVVVGALVTIGFVAGAVALIDENTSESAATTTLPVTTPTTMRALLDPSVSTSYLLDDPSLTPYSADVVTPPTSGEQVRVWTDGTALGPIVVFELHRNTGGRFGIVGATREVVDGYELAQLNTYCPAARPAVSRPCKLLISEVGIDDGWSVTVRATRLSEAEVIRITNNVLVVDGEITANSDLMEMLGLGLTFEAESLDDLIFGRVETAVRYLTDAGETAILRSAIGDADRRLAGIRYLTLDAQQSFYGRTYGYLVETGEAIVAWEDDGRLLSLVGPGDAGELATISQQVRRATDDEWSAMVYGLRPDYTLGDFATLATGRTSSAELWAAGPQIARRGGRTEFLYWWTVPGRSNVTDSTPSSGEVGKKPQAHFDTLVVPGATFVFVSQPNEGGNVTVRSAAGVEYAAKLTQPFPTQSDVFMAVVRIEEPGPISVEIDGVAVTP